MRNVYTTIICLCIGVFSSAQQKEINILLKELNDHIAEDTIRLNLLNNIAYTYQNIKPYLGIKTADEAIALAIKIHDKEKLATAYNYKGMNYSVLSRTDDALKMYNAAINILSKENLQLQTASVYNAMGVTYSNISDCYNAIQCYLKAMTVFESKNDKNGMAGECINISFIQNILDNNHDALANQVKAFELYKQVSNKHGMINALGSAGNSYVNLNKKEKALLLYNEALNVAKEIDYKRGIASTSSSIAAIYNGQNKISESLSYYKTGLAIFKEINDGYDMSFILSEMANIYAKADPEILVQNNIPPALRYETVIKYFNNSLSLATNTGNISVQASVYMQLAQLYKLNRDFSKAFYAFERYTILKDSISNDNKKQQITRLEMQNAFDKKQVLADAELQKQKVIKNSIIASSGFLFLAGFSGFAFYKRNREKKVAEFKSQVTETEMKALRAQMNPHFIFNSLNSIADYVDKNQTQLAADFTTKFAKLMRMVLENSEKKEVPLADDLKALELYMQLESLRLKNKFTYEIKVDDEIDKENTLIPPLILQPFVENSIWHGIAKKEGTGTIKIFIKKENENINCIVEDDGDGIKDTAVINKEKISLGMKITKARIDIINKIKHANASMKVFNKEKGVRAEIRLPLELSF